MIGNWGWIAPSRGAISSAAWGWRSPARRWSARGLAARLARAEPGAAAGAPGLEQEAAYYPPGATGMRGSHHGSFEVAHALRDGARWDDLGPEAETGEAYDLVVVGGGLSGLAAAYFFRKEAGPEARILVLDNCDDFGGHATRNEFRSGGRTLLINGGTINIEDLSAVRRGVAGDDPRARHRRRALRRVR